MPDKCPVCQRFLKEPIETIPPHTLLVPCENCEPFRLSKLSERALDQVRRESPGKLAVLSHAIWKMHPRSESPLLTPELIIDVTSRSVLPQPDEQLANLLLLLGESIGELGEYVTLSPDAYAAAVGAASDLNFAAICREATRRGWFEGEATTGYSYIGCLTFDGWLAYRELRRGAVRSRRAFMAMPFGSARLDAIFRECYIPAVAATGFTLRRLDDNPPAGLIDDRLRVEIRTARFLIAELTDGNHGAYWEAGFAEGLGKPVIYTCERTYFNPTTVHFDTSHHHTVLWDADNPAHAAELLKATIRATLPDESLLEDPE
jgi:hypothetical protein